MSELTEHFIKEISTDILVVGAGIAGISTALEAAETGYSVMLIEKNPYIGGRVAQLNQYFPKLCPPTCGLEINLRRLRENQKISLYTLAKVESVDGSPGNYSVKIKLSPRYVDNRCTLCGDCVPVCPIERRNSFNFDMDTTKAVYLPYNNAFPQKYVIDMEVCNGKTCSNCVQACKYNAINLDDHSTEILVKSKSLVWSTGWDPYNAGKLENLGFGKFPNVITNMMMERLSSPTGPTLGKIINTRTNQKIKSVAFVQCAGSRDENHLEYCSSVCCLASMKQAQYIREQYEDADIHIFYIDIRSPGALEEFYQKAQTDKKIFFHRGKVAKILEDPESKQLIVEAENTLEGKLHQVNVDLVVLATGMQPSARNNGFPDKTLLDESGFIMKQDIKGIIGCGVSTGPKEVAAVVQESTAAALKAIHIIKEVK